MLIIAEIGQNHNGDMDLAVELIKEAKKNGADIAKFQLYDAKALFPKEGNPWYDYNCKTEISRDDLNMLNNVCKEEGIEFMASVFDIERIAWLEEIGVKRHKIASRSIHEKEFIDAVLATNKQVLISLGMWDGEEFPVFNTTNENIDFLYCIAKYPTELTDLKFANVNFRNYAGFSDHTIGVNAPITAMAMGAQIIEKHFTLDKNMYGPDHTGSMDPAELKQLDTFRKELKQML